MYTMGTIAPGELPAGRFELPEELERTQDEQGPGENADDPEESGDRVGLEYGDPGEKGPGAGEEIAEVLPDRHSEVAVERLEHDVDRFITG